MFALLRWMRKRYEENHLLEETKSREIERRIQREKRDKRQSRASSSRCTELKRTMDPLIAAQVYNSRFCPFGWLPEELVLRILDFLDDDAVTLHCLRIVLEDVPSSS